MTVKKDILATLTYFNMFDYPLKKRELFIFLANKCDVESFEMALNILIEESAVFKIGNFYSLVNHPFLAERRSKGNKKAIGMLKKAGKAASIIAAFPFVRGVAVSGSLSKKFADEDADIDFFVVTTANRLWIARSFLHLFKKITFLFNKQDLFCMNYFIDEATPVIIEKNIYTATELTTLLPIYGSQVFENFIAANSWTMNFLPNNSLHISSAQERKRYWLIRMLERLLDNRAGNSVDNFLMKLTARSWHSKAIQQKKNSKGLLLGMHAGKHFSKPNPDNFQKKLLARYDKSLAEVFDQYEQMQLSQNKFL